MEKTEKAIQDAELGVTDGTLFLHSLAEVRELSTRMVSQAKRKVTIFTRDLDPAVYSQLEFISALKQLALKTQVAQIRILLQDNNLARSQGHRLIDLAQRVSSSIEIRKPNEEYEDFPDNFLLVDDCGYLHCKQAGRYDASASFNDRLHTSRWDETFKEAWESAEPDMELLRLYL